MICSIRENIPALLLQFLRVDTKHAYVFLLRASEGRFDMILLWLPLLRLQLLLYIGIVDPIERARSRLEDLPGIELIHNGLDLAIPLRTAAASVTLLIKGACVFSHTRDNAALTVACIHGLRNSVIVFLRCIVTFRLLVLQLPFRALVVRMLLHTLCGQSLPKKH